MLLRTVTTTLLAAALAAPLHAQISLPSDTKPVGSIVERNVASADTSAAALDAAVTANAKGDKAATVQALQTSAATLEAEANGGKTSFKDKLLAQAGNLKKLIPLVQSGMLGGGVLGKATGLASLALGGSRLEGLLGGGSLLGKAAALTGGLNLLKGGLGALGGPAQSQGGSLINAALGSVGQLSSLGAPAEPAVRSQLGSVLGFVKGVL